MKIAIIIGIVVVIVVTWTQTRFGKNWRGHRRGYSGCLICGDTWDWATPHTIDYSEQRGAFPCCEKCWQTKSNEKIIAAAEQFRDIWVAGGVPQKDAQIMVEAVKVAANTRARGKK